MNALRKRILQKPDQVLAAFRQANVPDKGWMYTETGTCAWPCRRSCRRHWQEIYPLKELYVKRTGVPLKTAYTKDVVTQCAQDMLRLQPLYTLLRTAADAGIAALDQ